MFTMKILSPFSTYLTLIMLFNAATNNGLTSYFLCNGYTKQLQNREQLKFCGNNF